MDCILRAVARWAVAGGCVLAILGQIRTAAAQVPYPGQGHEGGRERLDRRRRRRQRSNLVGFARGATGPVHRIAFRCSSSLGLSDTGVVAAVFDDSQDEPSTQSATQGDGEVQPRRTGGASAAGASRPAAVASRAVAIEQDFRDERPAAFSLATASEPRSKRSTSRRFRRDRRRPRRVDPPARLRPWKRNSISVQPRGCLSRPTALGVTASTHSA
jgi:hypothetical protein